MNGARRIALFLMVVVAVCVPSVVKTQDWRQYAAKARFLVITPGFVEWPATAFKTPTSPLQLCVYGEYPFGITLAQLARQEFVRGHRIEVKSVRKEQELAGCQVMFMTHAEAKRYAKALDAVKSSATLTIGEDPEFLSAGGMLSLQPTQNGVSFDVNLDAVDGGHLKLSSQLLSLARHIIQRSEPARG